MSTLTPFYVLFGRKAFQKQLNEDGKAKLKISGCIHHIKMQSVSMEKQLNSSGNFHMVLVVDCSSRDPERLREEEHPTRGLLEPDHLHVNVQ